MMERKPLLDPEVYQEIARRATNGGPEHTTWAEYLLLVSSCADILRGVPTTPDECEQFKLDEQIAEDLTRIAKIVNMILPGGIEEFKSYLAIASKYSTIRPLRQKV